MKLHLDGDAFRVLLEDIHDKTGYRTDVLEKDYYVVMMLKELAQKQAEGLPAYFKGGTALYKALKRTNRFSEDIDLSVDTRGCTRSQNEKRLEKAAKRYSSLPRDASEGRTNRSEVIAVYRYEPISAYDAEDALQRFGKLKIEATSFTISEPVSQLEISAMLYDLASDGQKEILKSHYGMAPFFVQTISIERVFIDKIFAAEAYLRQSLDFHRAFEAAKHIYDLAVISELGDIIAVMKNDQEMERLLKIRLREEMNRLDGIPGVLPSEFILFDTAIENQSVRKAYGIMQDQYVLRQCDRIEYDIAVKQLKKIKSYLDKNQAWIGAE